MAILACGALPPDAAAQVSVGVGLGAVRSSNLVRDSIVEPIAVRPRMAPQLEIRVTTPLSDRYQVAGELVVSHSTLMAHGDSSTPVTGLTVWAPAAGLDAVATSWLRVEARLGLLLYHPADPQGTLFSAGSPVTPVLGLGLRGARAIGGGLAGAVHVRYDVHRFTTSQLETRGFTGQTIVHRVSLGVSLHRSFGGASARD